MACRGTRLDGVTEVLSPRPLVTIGGFLGAGKTTLLNHLLQNSGGRRFVVFVNDFGAINIDVELVDTVETDRVSFRNGCVCCSLNNDLIASISDFVRQSEPPDGFLIEASGVADPRALDGSLDRLEQASLVRLDSRVYLIDADQFGALNYEDREEIIDHAAASDLVIINKQDLAQPNQLDSVMETLAESAPYSHVVASEHARVDANVVLDGLTSERLSTPDLSLPGERGHAADRYRSWSFESDQTVSRDEFEIFAEKLPGLCYRAKGFVRFDDGQSWLFNLVGVRASLIRTNNSRSRNGLKIVAIGRLDQSASEVLDIAASQLIKP